LAVIKVVFILVFMGESARIGIVNVQELVIGVILA
jgi:hypothetical protein